MYNFVEKEVNQLFAHPYSTNFTIGNTAFDIFCDGTFSDSPLIKKNTEDLSANKNKLFHNHFNYEIIFVEKGDILFETETSKDILSDNSIVLIPKNSLHLLRFEPHCKYYAIGFSYKITQLKDKLLDSFEKFDPLFNSGIIVQQLKSNNVFSRLVLEISDYLKNTRTFSYLIIQSLLQQFMLHLYECLGNTASAQSNDIQIVSNFSFALNQKINNVRDNSKLKDIAKELFISERQLSRIIKKQYGVSFTERKHQLRVESAKQLLKTTNLSIEKISEHVAFYDTATFIKQFTKRVGISPAQYRENHTLPRV